MGRPKEDPADKAARLRERRMSLLERRTAAQNNAAGMTSDLRAVYGALPMSARYSFLPASVSKPVTAAPGGKAR